ncbi:LysR family transcriptional regulator (chromosome initiation inhibitor) [Neisseria sp. HSC-16F19]|nr:LysR family transcriptional regulator ArgP [Neisseria sp. HSC-16F19]MCP2040944.1 LysR family transcriptional regulator (chromosome initiation inhibitor) [Neisseria sp. HSC-16F19]
MLTDDKQSAAFLAVLQWGSFERAAQALHLSPSAVSQRIRALEARLGCMLVTRGQPCVATKDGRKLLPFLRHAEWLAQEMSATFDESGKPLQLALAAHYDALDTWLMPVLAVLAAEEAVLFDISGDDQEYTLSWLAEGRVAAAISSDEATLHGCRATLLGWQHYRMIATPAFAARHFAGGITRTALANAPLLGFNRKDTLYRQFLQQHFDFDAARCPTHYIPASHAYFQAALCGMGWALIPDGQADAALAAGQLRDLAPDKSLAVPMYWHSWQSQTPRLARLSRRLAELAAEHLAVQP